MKVPALSPLCYQFPSIEEALIEPNGLLAYGGDLALHRVINAYQKGIFPWYSANSPILWWSPDPRAILNPHHLHISRSMNKFLKKQNYKITLNYAFPAVISACSQRHAPETWIDPAMQAAYYQLHQAGYAQSVEVWSDDILVGGLYGVALGSIFSGESMFSIATNASKCALIAFCKYFLQKGGKIIDCQIANQHTISLGAIEIKRADFLKYLQTWRNLELTSDCWIPKQLQL